MIKRQVGFAMSMGLASLMFTSSAFATQEGSTTATFLQIGQGARAEGMGGAFTAVADDAYSVYWNPAGMAQVTRQSIALNHAEFIEKVNSQFASYVLPFNQLKGSLGFGLTYVDLGKIDKTTDQGGMPSSDGTANVNSYAGTVGWGQAVGDRLALGGNVKFINQNLAGTTGSGFAADLGALVDVVPDRLMLGVSVLNLGPKMKTGTTDEDLPRTLTAGLAFRAIPRKLLFAVDGSKEKATDFQLRLGGEYTFQERYILRVGYQDTFDAKGGLSAGAGYIWHAYSEGSTDFFGQYDSKNVQSSGVDIRIDYAYVDYGDFDATHRIGLHVSF
jgi:hypothetical protein